MKYFFLVSLLLVNLAYGQDSNIDFLPKKTYRLTFPLLRASCEIKLGKRTSITPQAGFGFSFLSGSTYIGGSRFTEFGLLPVIDTDLKYYLTLTNRKRNGKINCLYKGLYTSFHPYLSFQLLGNYKYIYNSPEYGFQLNVGRVIQKQSNWYFNYYLGYSLFSRTIKTEKNIAETLPNGLSIGGAIGYSF